MNSRCRIGLQASLARLRINHSAVRHASSTATSSQRFHSGISSAAVSATGRPAGNSRASCPACGPMIELPMTDSSRFLQILMIGSPLSQLTIRNLDAETARITGRSSASSADSIHAWYCPTGSIGSTASYCEPPSSDAFQSDPPTLPARSLDNRHQRFSPRHRRPHGCEPSSRTLSPMV
jgi:hypothetical protein